MDLTGGLFYRFDARYFYFLSALPNSTSPDFIFVQKHYPYLFRACYLDEVLGDERGGGGNIGLEE
jgi:hypothetical protein